jgi:hypothetical protein
MLRRRREWRFVERYFEKAAAGRHRPGKVSLEPAWSDEDLHSMDNRPQRLAGIQLLYVVVASITAKITTNNYVVTQFAWQSWGIALLMRKVG